MPKPRSAAEAQPAVLIVDPSKVTLVAARKLLEPHFGVYLAEDGDAAWELLESIKEIASVFTDQHLRGTAGHDLLARIRNSGDPRIADLPVIITTSGDRNEATRRAALEAGATDFILKPFDAIDLLTRAKAWCHSSQHASLMREDNNALRELVLLDAETRAGNRDYFLQELIKDRSFSLRHGGEHTLMYVSVDGFERIQSEQGRVAAREALGLVAAAIRAKCRREDTFARVTESAFALSLLHTPPLGARVLAERIRQDLARRIFKPRGMTVTLTVSIGIAAPTGADASAEQLLETAARCARIAGRGGGNQVNIDSSLATTTADSAGKRERKGVESSLVPVHGAVNAEAALADTAAFVGELIPVLQQLSDAERLILIDRLLVMSETTSGA
ncbi:MAG: GGDEF domain-containing response regulator [Pseudomonadota bacterium]